MWLQVEYLPSKWKTLSSNPIATETNNLFFKKKEPIWKRRSFL
jgi:hypothetical protein